MNEPGDAGHDRSRTLNRVEAFSDGVFAIAITLLALELRVPDLDDVSGEALASSLADNWPSYVAFVLSFATILIMWVNHHGVFSLVHHADAHFMFANGLLLLVVSAVPFPTALVSRYLDTDAGEVAASVYAGVFVLIALSYNALWWSAAFGRRLLSASVSDAQASGVTRRFLLGPPVYLGAALVALVNAYLGMVICGLLWAFWTVMAFDPGRWLYPWSHVHEGAGGPDE